MQEGGGGGVGGKWSGEGGKGGGDWCSRGRGGEGRGGSLGGGKGNCWRIFLTLLTKFKIKR